MNVKFSRHAKRRAKLYKLPLPYIEKLLSNRIWKEGRNELIVNLPGVELPVKIVFDVKTNQIVVITNYPLKRLKRGEL